MSQQINIQSLIETDLFELLGLNDLPEERKEALFSKMMEVLQNRALVRIADAIPPEKETEWHKILESADQDGIRDYLLNLGIDLARIITEEALLLKSEMLSLSDAAAQ